jgi:cytochrome c-type biogenesis protein CcmF
MSWYTAKNMTKLIASFRVEKGGRPAGIMTAEQRAYNQREEVNTEVGIRRSWDEDLYLIFAGVDDANGVLTGANPRPATTFRVLVNPLISWIWLGGFIVAVGTLIAMWPSAVIADPKTARRPVTVREPELVEA